MSPLKNLILTIVFISITIKSASQNVDFCGTVNYTQIVNFDFEYLENYLLTFSGSESLYEEVEIKTSNTTKKTLNSDLGTTNAIIGGRKNTTAKFYYNNKVSFYFKDNFSDEVLFVKENSFSWNWNLHNETKKIGKFISNKATIKFRGREYIAWYTNDIPLPYGPWKFQGLPGLILEVYDIDEVFHIVPNKITLDNKNKCEISLNKEAFQNTLNIKNYLKRKEEIIENIFAEMSSRLPKGSKPLKLNKNCKDCKQEIERFNEDN